jgi:hypothetical protein
MAGFQQTDRSQRVINHAGNACSYCPSAARCTGIYGAIFPIIVADLMGGTGRFNVAQVALGAALSTTHAGLNLLCERVTVQPSAHSRRGAMVPWRVLSPCTKSGVWPAGSPGDRRLTTREHDRRE